jgi:hypothetical protein
MRDYWWIKDLMIGKDLIDTDPKAMGVYLALLYLRFWKENVTLKTKISSLNILNEDEARGLFAFYLAGKIEDTREASNAAVEFIDRLFNKGGEKYQILRRGISSWKISNVDTITYLLQLSRNT